MNGNDNGRDPGAPLGLGGRVERRRMIGGVDFDELKGQRIQVYTTITLDLSTARDDEELAITGNYIYGLASTDDAANASVKFNEDARASIGIYTGRGIRCPFYRLFFTNAAQAGKTLTLAIGVEDSTFRVEDLTEVSITEAIRPAASDAAAAYGALSVTTSATLIKAVNASRASIMVQNHDGTNNLFLGYDGSVTTANAGAILLPYGSIELRTTSAVYGIRSAGSGNAGYLEEINA